MSHPQSDSVVVSVLVDVDPATAFAVFTEDVDLWWKRGPAFRFSTASGTLRFEPGVGGRLVEVFGAGDDVYEVGRVLLWQPGKRLIFEFRSPTFARNECTEVDVRFEPAGSATRVTVEHRGWDAIPNDHPVRHGKTTLEFAGMQGNWWLQQLRALRAHAARG